MENLKFRLLNADEIDCRIATVTAYGVALLLYKDARVDQNILDETVGPFGWQRRHCRENANCIVSIWDSEKNQWIEKEDTGTESNTEKEKGLASDSFKRACFNWGIGRELYTAPRVFIGNQKCKVEEIEDRGRKKYVCRDQFYVSRIGYDDNRIINALEIKKRGGVVVFSTQRENDCKEETSNTNSEQHSLSEAQYNTVIDRLKKNHMTQKEIMQKYGVKSIYKLSQEQFRNFMDSTAAEEKQVPPPVTEEEMQKMIPPDDYSDLPI
ncbi:hypothetical protein [Hungatella effluvii]|uniref:hypothetical protein n=1 Tax=Hungatella effluvii TaxID=1096246 RepID=UPI002A7FE719|nr:hypothetical protein [Hungatella effluvii]